MGLIFCLQMCIAQGRFRAQNAYWERNLRIIESNSNWKRRQFFKDLHEFRDKQKVHRKEKGRWLILPKEGDEPEFKPDFAVKHHRDFWAPRMKGLPWLFGIIFIFLLIWSALNVM